MEQRRQIPVPSVERLCRYHRIVARARRFGPNRLSSHELAHLAAVTPEQVRKDLSYFGAFGRRGVGYDVERLSVELKRILGLRNPRRFSIIGAGNLGTALAGYAGFELRGFKLVALYDSNAARIGHMVQGLRVRDVASLGEDNKRNCVDMAILAVPEAAAQKAAEAAVAAGIKAILNFAPVSLRVPEGFVVRDVDMTGELEYLSFWLAYMDDSEG